MRSKVSSETTQLPSNPLTKQQRIWIYLLFVVVAFLFYGNSLKNGFSMDDELVTVTPRNTEHVVSNGVSGIGKIFTSHYAQDQRQSYSYRPVTTTSFAIEYELFQNSENRARISHFISVLLYGICGIVLFNFLCLTWGADYWLFSLLIGILFLIHPIHSEVVNNIKTRDELLVFIFGFWSAILFLKSFDSGKRSYLVYGGILFLLAVLSKESGMVFIGIIPLTMVFFRQVHWKTILVSLIVLGGAMLVLRIMTATLLNEPDVRYFLFFENPLFEMDFMSRIPVFFYCILFYLVLMVKPFPLKFYYGYDEIPLATFSSPVFYLGVLAVLILLYLALRYWNKKPIFSYAIWFFFLAIGGAANLVFPLPGIVAERFAMLASVGFVILLAVGLVRLFGLSPDSLAPKGKSLKMFGVVILIALPAWLYSVQRNGVWDSAFSLYRNDIKVLPRSMKAHSLLATEYTTKAFDIQKAGDLKYFEDMLDYADSARTHFQIAIDVYPNYPNSWNNLAVIDYNFFSDTRSSIIHSKKAIALDSTYEEAMFNLANGYGRIKKHYEQLLGYLKKRNLSSTSDSMSLAELRVIEKWERDQGAFQTLQILSQVETIFNSFWSKPVSPQLVQSFLRYCARISELDQRKRLSSFSEKVQNLSRYNQSSQVALMNGMIEQEREKIVLKWFKESQSTEQAFLAFVSKGVELYRDSFYIECNKLYKVNPAYFPLYSAVSNTAAAEGNHEEVLKWGHRFVSHFPDEKGQAFAQLGSAHWALQNQDSAVYYFSESIVYKQQELSRLREVPIENRNRMKIQQLTNEVNQIKRFLQEQAQGKIAEYPMENQ